MKDYTELLRRLRLGLLAVPLAAATAATTTAAGKPPGKTGGSYECDRGQWHTDIETARSVAKDDVTELGCPVNIDGAKKPGPAATKPKKPSDKKVRHPGTDRKFTFAFDKHRTERLRKKGPANRCVYRYHRMCPGRGRPLVVAGEDVLGAAVALPTEARLRVELSGLLVAEAASERERLAALWLEDALGEHASVASFLRAAEELEALGAPAALVTAHHQAAAEEMEHARTCFALAGAYAGQGLGPGPLPEAAPRPLDPVAIAAAVFDEGCVHETIGALVLQRAAARAEDPALVRRIRAIAGEEADHAALAWRTVRWALSRAPAEVTRELRSAMAGLSDDLARERGVFAAPRLAADPSGLARFGRLDAAGYRRCARDAFAGVVTPVLDTVLALEE